MILLRREREGGRRRVREQKGGFGWSSGSRSAVCWHYGMGEDMGEEVGEVVLSGQGQGVRQHQAKLIKSAQMRVRCEA